MIKYMPEKALAKVLGFEKWIIYPSKLCSRSVYVWGFVLLYVDLTKTW
jgi:hypothetical protein